MPATSVAGSSGPAVMAADAVSSLGQPVSDGAAAKVFVSYSRKDLAFVDRLEPKLRERGVELLIDRSEIYAFEDWWTRLQGLGDVKLRIGNAAGALAAYDESLVVRRKLVEREPNNALWQRELARSGLTAVLHTWGSAMTHPPHVHIVVPGGGLSLDGSRWIACRPGFFLPVRVLSRLFRWLFLKRLADAHRAGRLAFHGDLSPLADPAAFAAHLAPLR